MERRGIRVFGREHPFTPIIVEYNRSDDRTTRKWAQHPLVRTVQDSATRKDIAWSLRRVSVLERMIHRRQRQYAKWVAALSPFERWLVVHVIPAANSVVSKLRSKFGF